MSYDDSEARHLTGFDHRFDPDAVRPWPGFVGKMKPVMRGPHATFEHEGVTITDPDVDETGRFPVSRDYWKSCPCECNRGGLCGGCGHAGCGGRR